MPNYNVHAHVFNASIKAYRLWLADNNITEYLNVPFLSVRRPRRRFLFGGFFFPYVFANIYIILFYARVRIVFISESAAAMA